MRAKNTKTNQSIEYKMREGKIIGQFYNANGYKMSDGQICITFSWTHGEPTDDNFEAIVKEDVASRWGFEIQ